MEHWKIEGYDGTTLIYAENVRRWYISDSKIKEILKILAAKAGLTCEEIIGAYSRKNSARHNKLLEVHTDIKGKAYSCGDNPHFTAQLVSK
jgi:hypothetical protein